jgi:hypothetical protein
VNLNSNTMMSKLNAGVMPTDVVNPLLLNYTPKTRIQEESTPFIPLYDDEKQIIYNMRQVGTRSLKLSSTKKSGTKMTSTTDRKNEIDDSKNVK